MQKKVILIISFLAILQNIVNAEAIDSTSKTATFSGSVGITNNGFSIIPTFSLNSPATIINLAWRKNRFSFEPDIRLVPNLSKGGLLFWFRYRLVDNKKFTLRTGAHPAFSLIRRNADVNGKSTEITEMLRFGAIEIVPNYQITQNWGIGAFYLQGKGLQKHGPQNTKALFLNTNLSNIKLSDDFLLRLIPQMLFLKVDNTTGSYFTGTSILSNKKSPFSLQGTINKTINSNIAGNKDFMWNIMLAYGFNREYRRVK
jgi:hypothetical protein